MSRPTISCIIINYNNSECLEESILSVLNQTVPVDEVIVSDDASSDNSAEIIRSLAAKYKAVKPILRKKNLGVSQNRHRAILSSNSQLITTLDSDDFFYPAKIESELQALLEAGSDIAFSDVVLIDIQGNEKKCLSLEYFNKLTTREKIEALIRRKRPIPRDMLFKREIYDRIGGFSDKLQVYEDFDLKLRILTTTEAKWTYSHTRGTAYRVLAGGLSRSRPAGNMMKLYRIVLSHSPAIINKTGFSRFMTSLFDLTVFHIGKIISRLTK